MGCVLVWCSSGSDFCGSRAQPNSKRKIHDVSDSSDSEADDDESSDKERHESDADATSDDKSSKRDGGSSARDLGSLFEAVDSEVCWWSIVRAVIICLLMYLFYVIPWSAISFVNWSLLREIGISHCDVSQNNS